MVSSERFLLSNQSDLGDEALVINRQSETTFAGCQRRLILDNQIVKFHASPASPAAHRSMKSASLWAFAIIDISATAIIAFWKREPTAFARCRPVMSNVI